MLNEVIQTVSKPSWVEIAMLIVTTLYLLATIGVFLVNRKMAKAAKDQINTAMKMAELSKDVELIETRISLISSYEKEDSFKEHNPVLDILFPDNVQQLEKTMVKLMIMRQNNLEELLYLSNTYNVYHNNSLEFNKVNKVTTSHADVQKYTNTITEAAKKGSMNFNRRIISEEKAQELSDEVTKLTILIESTVPLFFQAARSYIKSTIALKGEENEGKKKAG